MIVIAERINATRKSIAKALKERDGEFIASETRKQTEAGASFIDVNAGSDPSSEIESLRWAVGIVQENTHLPLCLDCAGARGFEEALKVVEGEVVMLNSVNGEKDKLDAILPIAADRGALLAGLLMDERGLPQSVEDRLEVAEKIVEGANKAGVPTEKLYLDPCIQPLSTTPQDVENVIEAVDKIMGAFPGVHTTAGLSNIGFGLPRRSILNRVFLTYLIGAGMDSAIMDPTEPDMMATVFAAEALSGRDEFCMNYIQAERKGLLRP